MVQIPQGGLRQGLVIWFLIIFRFKSSEAQLELNFEAAFLYLPLYLYWDRLSEVFSCSWSSKLTQIHSCSWQGLSKKRAFEGFGNKCLNYTKQHNLTMLSQSLFTSLVTPSVRCHEGVWFLEITNISGPSETTEPQWWIWAHLWLPLSLCPRIFRNITTKPTQEKCILKKKGHC